MENPINELQLLKQMLESGNLSKEAYDKKVIEIIHLYLPKSVILHEPVDSIFSLRTLKLIAAISSTLACSLLLFVLLFWPQEANQKQNAIITPDSIETNESKRISQKEYTELDSLLAGYSIREIWTCGESPNTIAQLVKTEVSTRKLRSYFNMHQ